MRFVDHFHHVICLESEENSGPKAKLTYLEDLIIQKGKEGYGLFKSQIEELLYRFEGLETDQVINSKIDGSPGILFGKDPRPQFNGQFFVGVGRSINGAKTPKAVHNEQELNEMIANEGLRKTLGDLLKLLPSVYDNSGNIYQADVLFTDHMHKSKQKIDGEMCITFTPNLLTYAIPEDNKSELYNRVVKAQVGLVIHDASKGSTDPSNQQILLSSLGKNYQTIIDKSKAIGTVFVESSTHNDVSFNIDPSLIKKVNDLVAKAEVTASKIDDLFNEQWVNNPVLDKLQKYLGDQIKTSDGGIFTQAKLGKIFNSSKAFDSFLDHLMQEYKSPKKQREVGEWLSADVNKNSLKNLLTVFFYVRQVTDTLLDILYNMESKIGKSFVKLPDGSYQASRGEGFVLFHGSNHAKLVDRLDFTRSSKLYSKYNAK